MKHREKKIKCISLLWDVKGFNLHVIVADNRKEEKRKDKMFEEIISKMVPNLMNTINWQIQKAQETPKYK